MLLSLTLLILDLTSYDFRSNSSCLVEIRIKPKYERYDETI